MSDVIGIIGGSGVREIPGLEDVETDLPGTPFGRPSGPITRGRIEGEEVAFVARHGEGHALLPSEVPYLANIWALQEMGVTHVVSISAVGSLEEAVKPGDIVLPDQFIDRTRGRPRTFFGQGIVGHVAMGDPVCAEMRGELAEVVAGLDVDLHVGGTYVCIEGPQFSTRAESELFRSWGARVIGMTNLPEAWLAREAELCYQTVALATDYDCWHEAEGEVSVEAILAILEQNVENARRIVRRAVPRLAGLARACPCPHALDGVVVTDPGAIPDRRREIFGTLLGDRLD